MGWLEFEGVFLSSAIFGSVLETLLHGWIFRFIIPFFHGLYDDFAVAGAVPSRWPRRGSFSATFLWTRHAQGLTPATRLIRFPIFRPRPFLRLSLIITLSRSDQRLCIVDVAHVFSSDRVSP